MAAWSTEGGDASPMPAHEGVDGCRRDALWLLGLLAVAVAVRGFAWSRTTVLFNDGPIFLAMAEAISEGRWAAVLAHPFHPLYPALIALVARLPIGLESAGVLVSVAGGAMSVLGVFLFARAAFGRAVGWGSAWVVALHPWAVDFSSDVMSDGLYAGFFLLGFAAMARTLASPGMRTGLVCGLLAGLAYLVRPEGLGLVVVALCLLIGVGSWGGGDRRALVRAGLGIVLGAALCVGPMVLAIADQTGDFALTRKKSVSGLAAGRTQVLQNPAQVPDAAARPSLPLPRSSERVGGRGAQRPPQTIAGALEALSRAGRTSLASLRYEVAFFAIVGLGSMRGRWRPHREAAIGLTALLYTGLLVLLVWGAGYVARRHALAALLPIVGYAVVGFGVVARGLLDRIRSALPPSTSGWASAWGVTTVLVVTLALVWGPRDLRARRVDREPVRLAAQWLGRVAPEPGQRVAAQKLRVAYYAGREFVPLPSGDEAPIREALLARGVSWVVIDERRLDDHRGLREGVGDWLVPIHDARSGRGRAFVLAVTPAAGI